MRFLITIEMSTNQRDIRQPFELIFGRLALTPSYNAPESEDLLTTYDQYLRDLITKLNELQVHAKEKLITSKHRNEKYYDKRVNA